MRIFWSFVFICQCLSLIGQNFGSGQDVHGRILCKETNDPIPYVIIFNSHSQIGTLSDMKGNFKISTSQLDDTLFVSCIGFKKQRIQLSAKETFYTIYLEQSIQLLEAVTIRPPDDGYLYELLIDCKKESSTDSRTAKAYYEIKSYAGDSQIELLEEFFNAELSGYDLSELELKTGRFALKKTGDRFFNSMESSRAIVMNGLFNENEYFPKSPLVFSKSKMKKKFWLELEKKYLENNIDSIYVISYRPKDSSGVFFNGQIWVNPQKKHVIKTTFNCRNCSVTPFIPLFSTDKLSNINLNITKTYKEIDNEMFFNHIDFTYQFDYESRIGKEFEAKYCILTNAVLHVYDYENSFFIPKFSFDENCVRDYFKINAMPYNDFFWANNNEFEISDHDIMNSSFYKENEEFSNKTWYLSNNKYFKKVFEYPFITWSEKRVLIKDVSSDTAISNMPNTTIIADRYKLSIKIFMDLNTYSDSTNVITSTVFDPWETFYYLPVDSSTNCFLNILFDIYEIERRNFEKSIQGLGNDNIEILSKFETMNEKLDKLKSEYLAGVDRGTKREELEKWNQYVLDNLGINNMRLFNLIE